MSQSLPLLRRLAVLVVSLLCLLGVAVVLPVSSVPAQRLSAVADTASSYDRSVRGSDCALLGRASNPTLGCSRVGCRPGAVLWRKTPGAEACALPDQPEGYGYGATVPIRTCEALHRRWVASVNYCASQPDRSVVRLADAPQCVAPYTVYVTLKETEGGGYDVCVTPARASVPRSRLVHWQRVLDSARGGTLVVGDSISWRGSDELTRLEPALTIDGEPGRRPSELSSRLRAFVARHGEPDGVVVELGTNPAPGYTRDKLAAALRTLPSATRVLLVLPYVAAGPGNSAAAARFGGWMRSLASSRAGTCVADWPAYVRAHRGVLQDGIHPRNAAEGEWAGWLTAQWRACR